MREQEGFSLVEVIVAMMLLAVVVVALLPGLWLGVMNAARQSTTATAERFLSSLVEEARETPTCTAIPTLIGRTTTDGNGRTLTSAAERRRASAVGARPERPSPSRSRSPIAAALWLPPSQGSTSRERPC